MVVAAAQKLKETEITEQDSLLLTRNLLRIAIFNISYIRGLFPEKYFNDKSVPALEMKIKKLMPMDAESRRLIDWMEKGVHDALSKKYLKTLLFCVSEAVDGPKIEEYTFSFSYSNCESQEVMMNINRTGNKKQGTTFKSNTVSDITPNQMRSSACKMVRTLVQLMRTLDRMPEERVIVMKLLYYDDVTPLDYEPPFFKGCSEQEANNAWMKKPLKMEVGNVNSKHFVLALKVKSVLDPCEDENEEIHEEEDMSLGGDTVGMENSSDSDSDSEAQSLGENNYIVAPIAKKLLPEDNDMADEDSTQNAEEDEEQLARLRTWVEAYQADSIELTDMLSSFPDISMALIEEILEKLVNEGTIEKAGMDIYTITNRKIVDSYANEMKEESVEQVIPGAQADKSLPKEDFMYMKALYHALPMDYMTVSKLQKKLEGEANQNTVRKLIDKMAVDGFVEIKTNRRLGKRVIHSEATEKMLAEVQKVFDNTATAMKINEPIDILNIADNITAGSNQRDTSTCANLHSIGSDLTRTQRTARATKEQQENTPMSKAEPVASRESTMNDRSGTHGRVRDFDDGENTVCSRSSQDKRSRKTSTVKEPILQSYKRQKAVAV